MKNLIFRLDKLLAKNPTTPKLQKIIFPDDLKPNWEPEDIQWVEDCTYAILPPKGWSLYKLLGFWSPPGGWPKNYYLVYAGRKRPEVGSEEDKKEEAYRALLKRARSSKKIKPEINNLN